jgi:TATA-box binding protein (TBP) (component of TFIID and TFIIIB)
MQDIDIDNEWKAFLVNQNSLTSEPTKTPQTNDRSVPKCEDLNISTKTKVLFLNQSIDINTIFWKIPVIEYWKPIRGVVKKQMKIVSKTPEEYEAYREKLADIPYYTENIIKQINNPEARRLKFKDERKITVGLSKKDIMNSRGKVKNAFYNCFAVIMRFQHEGVFREIHVKIFNTGKMEIPGVVSTQLLDKVKAMILDILREHNAIDGVDFVENAKEDSVLINSNFNCGFYIHRDRLHAILRGEKYSIESAYDPCSYPGVKCKFYFNHEYGFDTKVQRGSVSKQDLSQKKSELVDNKRYTEVSFMIFRTGSCLIVGNCSEEILNFIYDFVKNMLEQEYPNICASDEQPQVKIKKTKPRMKVIQMTADNYEAARG